MSYRDRKVTTRGSLRGENADVRRRARGEESTRRDEEDGQFNNWSRSAHLPRRVVAGKTRLTHTHVRADTGDRDITGVLGHFSSFAARHAAAVVA